MRWRTAAASNRMWSNVRGPPARTTGDIYFMQLYTHRAAVLIAGNAHTHSHSGVHRRTPTARERFDVHMLVPSAQSTFAHNCAVGGRPASCNYLSWLWHKLQTLTLQSGVNETHASFASSSASLTWRAFFVCVLVCVCVRVCTGPVRWTNYNKTAHRPPTPPPPTFPSASRTFWM